MRLGERPTVPEVLPALRKYDGLSLRPFMEYGHMTDEWLADCETVAIERGDRAGLLLARKLMRMTRDQRRKIRLLLTRRTNAS